MLYLATIEHSRRLRKRYFAWVHVLAAVACVMVVGQYRHIDTLDKRLAAQGDVLALIRAEQQLNAGFHAEIALLKRQVKRYKIIEYIRTVAPHQPAKRIATAVLSSASHYDLDPELLLAVYKIESAFNPHAISETNARGIAQIVRTTAEFHGMPWHKWRDIETSVRYGAEHLRWQLNRSSGNLWTALGRYNGWSDKDYQRKVFAVRAKLAAR